MEELITFVIYASIYIGLIATTFYVLSFLKGGRTKDKLFTDGELPVVSVLIPAYNEGKSIAATLDSILSVDYPCEKLEVIVVDDGSRDNTFEQAKKYESDIVKVFHKENGGKSTAMNFALEHARGEIVISMDADSYVSKNSVNKMVRLFKDEEVMCVSPAIVIDKARTILQRIQSVEYLFGIFLRKAFSNVNAVHITPGAFSAYRKSFFDKYGGYEIGNITEDLEVAMRIQYKGYVIKYCPEAIAYTIAPRKFLDLLVQRRRWYVGLMKNTWKYKKMIFNPKYGDLGMFVFPIAWISIFFTVFVTAYLFFKTIFDVKEEMMFLQSINFDFVSTLNLNFYFIERVLFLFFTNKVVVFLLFFVVMLGFFLYYASTRVGRISGWHIGLVLYFMFFAILFGFWWIVSIIYVLFNRKVVWRRG